MLHTADKDHKNQPPEELTDVHPPLRLLIHGRLHRLSQAYTMAMLVIEDLAPGSNFMGLAALWRPFCPISTLACLAGIVYT